MALEDLPSTPAIADAKRSSSECLDKESPPRQGSEDRRAMARAATAPGGPGAWQAQLSWTIVHPQKSHYHKFFAVLAAMNLYRRLVTIDSWVMQFCVGARPFLLEFYG